MNSKKTYKPNLYRLFHQWNMHTRPRRSEKVWYQPNAWWNFSKDPFETIVQILIKIWNGSYKINIPNLFGFLLSGPKLARMNAITPLFDNFIHKKIYFNFFCMNSFRSDLPKTLHIAVKNFHIKVSFVLILLSTVQEIIFITHHDLAFPFQLLLYLATKNSYFKFN